VNSNQFEFAINKTVGWTVVRSTMYFSATSRHAASAERA
jgi:hypothetical protein